MRQALIHLLIFKCIFDICCLLNQNRTAMLEYICLCVYDRIAVLNVKTMANVCLINKIQKNLNFLLAIQNVIDTYLVDNYIIA